MNKGLLEKYTGAAAAYSVRLLDRNYTGPLFKIRRVDVVSSQSNGEIFVFPDDEGWISVDSKVVDPSNVSSATVLGEFVNAQSYTQADGSVIGGNPQHAFISVWKDQSGNANDASQEVAGNQPKIYDAVNGIITENGKPAVEFDGSNDHLDTADFTPLTQPNFITLTHKGNVANGTKWIFSTSTSNTNRNFFLQDGRYYAGSFVSSGSVGTSQVNISILADGANTEVFKNGLSVVTGNAGTNGIQKIRLFADRDGGVSLSALFQEFILWNSNDSNRTDIEDDINKAFNIYSVALAPNNSSFLGKYPGAEAAYSVRNLTGKDKQPIVKVRRELGTDLDTEQTMYAGPGGFLDRNQLANFVNGVSEDPRLPLDISEGFGYSLRVVKAGYTGPLIEIRESGGNTTKDIYADSSGKINEQALLDFCGSNDGHVSKWYNQGGVDRTLTADAASNQPKIVESGVVVRDTLNNIAIKFTNAEDHFLAIRDTTVFDLQEQCVAMHFMPTALQSSGNRRILGVIQPAGEGFDQSIRNTLELVTSGDMYITIGTASVLLVNLVQTVNSPSILTINFKGSSSSGTSNKTTQTASLTAKDVKGLSIGERFTSGSTPDMVVAEVIQYTSAQIGDNKTEIEASLNKNYQIYGDAYVSTWFDQSLVADSKYLLDSNPGAAAAYSLRKLREEYTGPAIEVRRDSDEKSKTVGFTDSGELDLDTLINFCSGYNGYVAKWYNQAFNSTNELLLDTPEGTGAEAAYSVRQLSATATECMIIRRASDSKLRTIGFKNKNIDEAAIESFCTGTSCTVVTWKDQSGNGNDATAAAPANEPTIYTGGAIVKENGNGKPAVKGTGNSFLTYSAQTFSGDFAFIGVQAFRTNAAPYGGLAGNFGSVPLSGLRWKLGGIVSVFSIPSTSLDTPYLAFANRASNVLEVTFQGVSLGTSSNSGTAIFSQLMAGNGAGSLKFNGNSQETIFYSSDKSGTDRTSIEENINGYYGIYSTNNAEQDTPLNQPKIYDSATGVMKENGKPALDFDGTDDSFDTNWSAGDTSALTAFNIASPTNNTTSSQLYDLRDSNDDGLRLIMFSDSNLFYSANTNDLRATAYVGGQQLIFSNYANSTISTAIDGASTNTGSAPVSTSVTANATLFKDRGDTFYFNGKAQEVIFYLSDESNNRLEIEGNINSHYRVYNCNDASQSTANAQPKIYSGTTGVILENGKVAVQLDGNDDFLLTNQSIRTATAFVVEKGAQSSRSTLFGASSIGQQYLRTDGTGIKFQNGLNSLALTGQTSRGYNLIYLDNVSSITSLANNGGSSVTASLDTVAIADFVIGKKANQDFYKGNLQEIITYNLSQSNFRTGIEANINNSFQIYWDGSIRGLLDDQPNAAAAYSVRALRSTYTGPLLEIRDANGNTQDIYATYNGDLDENAINNFCTGTTCTVATWYDQSGNSNDASQGTALKQPTIYTGGAIVKENGSVAMAMDYHFLMSSSISTNTFSIFAVGESDGDSYFMNLAGGNSQIRINEGNQYLMTVYPSTKRSNSGANHNQQLAEYIGNSTILNFFQNGTNAGTASSHTINQNVIGGFTNQTQPTTMNYQELILYTSDKSTADRTSIESNINGYYNIYSKLPGNKLLNKYPGAAAAFSLRAINSLYVGPLVRVRRASDNVHADVYVDINLTISDTSKVGILSNSTDPIEPKSNTSLKTFMSGADGFVSVWYDQAESNDAEQSAALNQPKLYDGQDGVETENGKPIIELVQGSSSTLLLNSAITSATSHLFGVGKVGDTNHKIFIGISAGNGYLHSFSNGSGGGGVGTDLHINGAASSITTQGQVYSQFVNQTLFNTKYDLSGATQTRIGMQNGGGDSYKMYNTQEFIIYTSAQSSANRAGIESDINNHYSIYAKPKKLLDEFGGAAAAYSLRRLSSNYAGPLVKIRRDSDNVEVNVYPDIEGNFSLNSRVTNIAETTTGSSQADFSFNTTFATLSQFVEGDPNCFVVEWKDQSSNNNHATQDASANQPKIYDGTTGVVTENGKPSLSLSNSFMNSINAMSFTSDFFVSSVFNTNTTQGFNMLLGSYNDSRSYLSLKTNEIKIRNSAQSINTFTGASISYNQQHLFTFSRASNSLQPSVDGNTQTAQTTSGTYNFDELFAYSSGGNSYRFGGNCQELILYPSDQSSNRTNIETNINTFYNIYS